MQTRVGVRSKGRRIYLFLPFLHLAHFLRPPLRLVEGAVVYPWSPVSDDCEASLSSPSRSLEALAVLGLPLRFLLLPDVVVFRGVWERVRCGTLVASLAQLRQCLIPFTVAPHLTRVHTCFLQLAQRSVNLALLSEQKSHLWVGFSVGGGTVLEEEVLLGLEIDEALFF